jgi:hypothetical protein
MNVFTTTKGRAVGIPRPRRSDQNSRIYCIPTCREEE